jgi:hypothetical protein
MLGIDKGSRHPFRLSTGQRTRAVVRVTREAGQDHITVQIDDQTVLDWRGDRDSATKRTLLMPPYDATINLGPLPGDGNFTFHQVRLKMLDGRLELLRANAPARQ